MDPNQPPLMPTPTIPDPAVPVQPPIPPVPPEKTNSKNLKKIIKIIFLLLILTGLMFVPLPYYQKDSVVCKPDQTNCPKQGWNLATPLWQYLPFIFTTTRQESAVITTSSPTPTASSMSAENLTAKVSTKNWKTYANENLGISFRHPPDYQIEENGEFLFVINPLKNWEEKNICLTFNAANLSYQANDLNSLVNRFLSSSSDVAREIGNNFEDKLDIIINGLMGVRLSGVKVSLANNRYHYLNHDLILLPHQNYLYQIMINNTCGLDSNNGVIDTILSTIVFNKKLPDQDLSGYINNPHNYAFNYPASWLNLGQDLYPTFLFEDGKIEIGVDKVKTGTTLEKLIQEEEEIYYTKDQVSNSFENINGMRFLVSVATTKPDTVEIKSYTTLDDDNRFVFAIYFWDELVDKNLHAKLLNDFENLIRSFRVLKNK